MSYRTIGQKRVYTREQHHNVLEAWADARDEAGAPLALISFDYHTDTLPAFADEVSRRYKKQHAELPARDVRDALCADEHARIDWSDRTALKDAVMRLSHDEHIDAAVRAGILGPAFVVLGCYEPGSVPPWATVIVPPCPLAHTGAHDAECTLAFCNALLEDHVLQPIVARVEAALGAPIDRSDYILDVDLDYFRTARGIAPTAGAVFDRLIRHARLITVAEEPGCVGMLRLKGESIIASELLAALYDRIAAVAADL
ncbi:MAG: UPF0489 family protein [Deltaproteobacteria bacterium]|nr:UPF0489 family protein [Deltaproteobacteria bacterium]